MGISSSLRMWRRRGGKRESRRVGMRLMGRVTRIGIGMQAWMWMSQCLCCKGRKKRKESLCFVFYYDHKGFVCYAPWNWEPYNHIHIRMLILKPSASTPTSDAHVLVRN